MQNVHVTMENLSSEGKLAMKENQITAEDIYTFTEGDINDLFKSFGDRRIVRKLIHLKQGADYMDQVADKASPGLSLESETTETSCTSDLDLDTSSETEKSSTSSVSSILTPITKYKVDDMLRKKAIRTKSSSAQTYFNSLMKDAMKATKLWKNPITLQEITNRKKEEFHTIIENHVPALKSKRSEIWRRVGEHLQNRRKYLKDLNSGKRVKFLAQRKAELSEKRKKNDELGLCDLKPGDLVKLKHSCDGTSVIVGTGIFLGKEDDMYSNVVLKSKDMDAKIDVDLPAVSPDGATTIKTAGVKQMILFWTKKLEKVEVKKKKATPNTSRKLDEMFKQSSCSTDTDCDANKQSSSSIDVDHLPSKSKSVKRPRNDGSPERLQTVQPKGSAAADEDHDLHIDSNDEDLPVIEKKKRRYEKQTQGLPINESKCSKREIQFRSFVLMEWANKKMFWGVKCVTETAFLVRNSVKSCGKLNTDGKMTTEECRVVADNTDNLRLSSTDIEVNPDMRYCIWEVPKENELLKLDSKLGKFGCLSVVSQEKFENLLQKKLQSYVDK